MLVDLPRRWQWTIGAGCALVTVIALLFVVFSKPDADAVITAAAGAPVNVETAVAVVAPDAVDPPPAPEPVDAHGADEVQVCGGAWVATDPDGTLNAAELERATQAPSARDRVVANLRTGAGEFGQAAALMLQMLGDAPHRTALRIAHGGCRGAGCGDTSAQATDDVAQARNALARLAVGTSDPQVYALAFQVCNGPGAADGACRLLSAGQWARLDPDNAAPWMAVLDESTTRGDRAAQDDALFHMASARRQNAGFFALPGAILGAMPDDDAARLAAWAMVGEAINFEASLALPVAHVSQSSCSAPALRDANRAQVCAGVAELLVERSETFLDRLIGAAIGKRLGWPAERTDRVRGEYAAYVDRQMSRPAEADEGNEFSCAAIDRGIALVRRHASLGEVGALREWVAQSGQLPDYFIAEERRRQRQAAASAPAASGASIASN